MASGSVALDRLKDVLLEHVLRDVKGVSLAARFLAPHARHATRTPTATELPESEREDGRHGDPVQQPRPGPL